MQILIFELRGNIGHFRRPDTTVTHASYPFITRTVLSGLLASILGLERLSGENWLGLQLLSRVQTVSQEMSMHGKGWLFGGDQQFNRPTAIELVVNPHYRVYYAGEHLERLSLLIKTNRSCYHTYLGSAYCLTFPKFRGIADAEDLRPSSDEVLETRTVVPSHAISRLIPREGSEYGRVGGMQYEHVGDRKFRGTINIVYEVAGRPIVLRPAQRVTEQLNPYRFLRLNTGEVVCLW